MHVNAARQFVSHYLRALRTRPRDAELCEAFGVRDAAAMRRAVLDAAARVASPARAFRIAAGPSTVAGAGLGLFVAGGAARAGDGLALYPGLHYPDAAAWADDGHRDASYVLNLSCYDGAPRGLIDAAANASSRPEHPEHRGELVNHPPRGRAANVAPAPFFWAETRLEPINEARGAAYLGGVVFVALADVGAGEELFLDYRLRWQGGFGRALTTGESGLPEWYPPPP